MDIDCDVLVIGAAAAGLTAAIEAREQGASVVVATKGRAGRSGNTVVAGAGLCAFVPYEGNQDSQEQHFRDTMAGGRQINDERLVRLLTEWGGERVLKLAEWGVQIVHPGTEPVHLLVPGHSRPRGIHPDCSGRPSTLLGLSISAPMAEAAAEKGVRFLEQSPVVRLVLDRDEVVGAVVADIERDALLMVRAGAVVMAAGGAGHIYANTNNARGISGDSYGLLLAAGARLRDMEFVQFFPTWMSSPFKSVVDPSFFSKGAVLRNRFGERFMDSYDPENAEMATRDVLSRAIFSEVRKGNGVDGQVYMDCTAVPDDVWQLRFPTLRRDLRRHGVDVSRDWLKVGPTVHFFMGGAEIDVDCTTDVPGLFAAGEAVGGVHGANRLGGNALTEAVVFGTIAGRSAAEYARGRDLPPQVAVLEAGSSAVDGEPLDVIRRKLRIAMWDGASIVRSARSLRATLSAVEECRAALGPRPASASRLAEWEETRMMCLTAGAVAASALAREESRGAHYREDYPSTDDGWLGSHRVRLVGDKLQLGFEPKRQERS